MQARAIFEAARAARDEGGNPFPEVMVPLVGIAEEALRTRRIIETVAAEVFAGTDPVHFLVGTMIEVPRAALIAGRIAAGLDFFSFGTNDLTQMTFGFSRDDTAALIGRYVDQGILAEDPFGTLDREGVGALIRMAAESGRAANPALELGICGEHGGDPRSVALCREIGLDYVSASPFRIPAARLAASRA
jgi:pyruvate,orthophosphate dikinase